MNCSLSRRRRDSDMDPDGSAICSLNAICLRRDMCLRHVI